jgi:4-hydroxybenzoate polyprenyltransferase
MASGGMTARFWAYLRLARFDKPQGALLLLWPTLWALWLAADGRPSVSLVLIFVGGVFAMRAFGCAINDFADRRIDAQVARTRLRPLASGEITPPEALAVAAFFLLCSFLLFLTLSPAAMLWAAGALVVAASYPLAKRITRLPQAHLAAAFSFGIPIAFAQARGETGFLCAALIAANMLWVLAYDTIYAMADRPDDLKIGVNSSAILFGRRDVFVVVLCYVLMLLWLSAIGVALRFGMMYQFALMVAMALAFSFYRRIRGRDPGECFAVFCANHWLGAAVFLGVVAAARG